MNLIILVKTSEIKKLLVRFSRQNVVSQVNGNSKFEAKKLESSHEASKSQKRTEKKM
jgi:hypothetical protein